MSRNSLRFAFHRGASEQASRPAGSNLGLGDARKVACFVSKISLQRDLLFPVRSFREFGCKPLNLRVLPSARIALGLNSAKFPVYFPVSREFRADTGSRWTASSANQSRLL